MGRRSVEPWMELHMHVLMLLREMGLDPASDEARRAVGTRP